MISAVAFCPQAPVLVPDVARGAAGELENVRAACRTSIRRLVAPDRRLVVLGGGGRDRRFAPTARGSFAGFGLDLEVPLGSDELGSDKLGSDGTGPVELPPSLTVGAWLLRDGLGPNCGAVGYEVTEEPAVTQWNAQWEDGGDLGVLVVGDGSARRTVKAPGYLDERAAGYDRTVVTALGSGDPAALVALDPVLGAELLAAGAPAWRRVGGLLAGRSWAAELLHESDPYGVDYVVASWTAS